MHWAAVYAVVMPLVVSLLATPKIWDLLTGPNAAEWVQAIGSIFAIIGSVAIAIYIDQSSARRENERVRRRIVDFMDLITGSILLAYAASDGFRDRPSSFELKSMKVALERFNETEWEALRRLLEQPILDWPSPLLYTRAARFMNALGDAFDAANSYVSEYGSKRSNENLDAALKILSKEHGSVTNTIETM